MIGDVATNRKIKKKSSIISQSDVYKTPNIPTRWKQKKPNIGLFLSGN